MKWVAFGQPELSGDVFLHQRRGGGGQRQHRSRAQARQILAKHPIVGAKVVAPLRNAVRFIDGDQRWFSLGQHFGKARHPKPFGSDKQELQLAVQVVDADAAGSFPIAARMNALDGESPLL